MRSTHCRNAPETAQKEVTVSIREGEHGMLISVDDSGAGIAADKLDRIFERGFSTKGEGREVPVCHSSRRLWTRSTG